MNVNTLSPHARETNMDELEAMTNYAPNLSGIKVLVDRLEPIYVNENIGKSYIEAFELPTTTAKIIEAITKKYGGGKYLIRVCQNGLCLKTSTFEISGSPKLQANPPSVELANGKVIKKMNDKEEKASTLRELLVAAHVVPQNFANKEDLEQVLDTTEALSTRIVDLEDIIKSTEKRANEKTDTEISKLAPEVNLLKDSSKNSNSRISQLEKHIKILEELIIGMAHKQSESTHELNVLKSGLPTQPGVEEISEGIYVWSKATGKGPWLTIGKAEIEAGLGSSLPKSDGALTPGTKFDTRRKSSNLHEIPRLPGWIVRDASGEDYALPTAELTTVAPHIWNKNFKQITPVSRKMSSRLLTVLLFILTLPFSPLKLIKK